MNRLKEGLLNVVLGACFLLPAVPSAVADTNAVVGPLTSNTNITWNWKKECYLGSSSDTNGFVSGSNGWHGAGSTGILDAVANEHYVFDSWSGTINSTNNPLYVAMNSPHTVQANFKQKLTEMGTPEKWLDEHNLDEDLTDPDKDGHYTWEEYVADTVPTNTESVFYTSINGPSNVVLNNTSLERTYGLNYRESLTDGAWQNYTNGITGNGGSMSIHVDAKEESDNRHYQGTVRKEE